MASASARPEFSIVTACLNSGATVRDTVQSVLDQKGVTTEHVIKDGGSQDETLEIVREVNSKARIVVRVDRGVYDAMNQGFEETSGEIVAFLNSDDYYTHDRVLARVLEMFERTSCDIVFGDIRMIDSMGHVRRIWRGRTLTAGSLDGMQLPHPAVFIRRDALAELDFPFDPSYQISADLKQQLILVEKKCHSVAYIAEQLTCMRTGGESTATLLAMVRGWTESARAYREVHGKNGCRFVLRKVLLKVQQLRFPSNH